MIQKFKLLIHLARHTNNTPKWTPRILVWITDYIYYQKTPNYLLKSKFYFFNSLWWSKKSFNYKHWWNQYCESTIWYWTQVSKLQIDIQILPKIQFLRFCWQYFFSIYFDRPYSYRDVLTSNVNRDQTCTSVIISDRFVVTAAHCIVEFQPLK